MCGIVGATSDRNVVPILIEGIRRLEYRGYDSTGLAVVNGGASPILERLVSTARVADLAAGEYAVSVAAAGCEADVVLVVVADEAERVHDVELEPAGVPAG